MAALRHRHRPFRLLLRCLLQALAIGVAIVLAAAGALAGFFAAATFLDSPPDLFAAALALGFSVAFAVVRGAAGVTIALRPLRPAAAWIGAGATALLAVGAWATVLQPLPSTAAARRRPAAPRGVRYWNLPTGSNIAYLEVPAHGTPRPDPIIFVGGGPGEEDVADASETHYFGQLADLGYNVYFYDQIGAGLSGRLANPGQYTVTRQVADLNAIRARVASGPVILMGASWGGSLVAHYMAAHPHAVAKAILTSPAPIDYSAWPHFGSILTHLSAAARRRAAQMLDTPRFLLWYALGLVNPRAAHALVSDRQADAFFSTLMRVDIAGAVQNAARLPSDTSLGLFRYGFYDNIFTTRSASRASSTPQARRKLASNRTPSLIVTGTANYIRWAPTLQYRKTLPDSVLVCLPRTGHEVYLDRPALYMSVLRAFLLGRKLPIHAWATSAPCAATGA